MKRREFITVLGGAVVAPAFWPPNARAQQPKVQVIGFLTSRSQGEFAGVATAFFRGLGETGYVEGRNVTIEYRFADGQYDRLSALVADLVRRRVDVIFAHGSPEPGLAAEKATTTIPIVFMTSGDPVEQGLVTNINRPDRNATGVTQFAAALNAKRLGLLLELVGTTAPIAALMNPRNSGTENQIKDVQAAARALKQQIQVVYASNAREIDAVFATLVQQRVGALLVGGDTFFASHRDQLAALAAQHSIPAIYNNRDYVSVGGLISYGAVFAEVYRQAGVYVGRILKGAKPVELPVVLPSKFELVINLKSAKALSLTVPPTLLARADAVIE